jgi:hypothetical protein
MNVATFASLTGYMLALLAAFWLVSFASQRREGIPSTEAGRNSTLWVGILIVFSAIDYLSVAEYV